MSHYFDHILIYLNKCFIVFEKKDCITMRESQRQDFSWCNFCKVEKWESPTSPPPLIAPLQLTLNKFQDYICFVANNWQNIYHHCVLVPSNAQTHNWTLSQFLSTTLPPFELHNHHALNKNCFHLWTFNNSTLN